jgi:hypothetical protein
MILLEICFLNVSSSPVSLPLCSLRSRPPCGRFWSRVQHTNVSGILHRCSFFLFLLLYCISLSTPMVLSPIHWPACSSLRFPSLLYLMSSQSIPYSLLCPKFYPVLSSIHSFAQDLILAFMSKAVSTFETSLKLYQTTWYILEESLHICYHKNLKSRKGNGVGCSTTNMWVPCSAIWISVYILGPRPKTNNGII